MWIHFDETNFHSEILWFKPTNHFDILLGLHVNLGNFQVHWMVFLRNPRNFCHLSRFFFFFRSWIWTPHRGSMQKMSSSFRGPVLQCGCDIFGGDNHVNRTTNHGNPTFRCDSVTRAGWWIFIFTPIWGSDPF